MSIPPAPIPTGENLHEIRHHNSDFDHQRAQLEVISRWNNAGVTCITRGEHDEAGQNFRRALNKASEVSFYSSPATNSFSGLQQAPKSLYIYQRGEYDEGMHTFSSPCPLEPQACPSMHAATATILFNLGQLHLRVGQLDEALSAFFRALQISQWSGDGAHDKPEPGSGVSSMAILHNVGHVQYRLGHYEEALRTYAKALHLGRASFGKSSHKLLEVAATFNCLGVLYFHLPKAETDKAKELYLESLSIRRSVLGQDCETVEIATTLNNIGRIHYMRGEYAQALRLYKEALRMRKRILGDDHLDVAAVTYNLGQTYHQMSELDVAMEYYHEFLVIARQRLGPHHRKFPSHIC